MYQGYDIDRIFNKEKVFISTRDVMPESTALKIFGKDAIAFVRRAGYCSGFGIGDYTATYLTYEGVQIAATFCNVEELSHKHVQESGDENVQ